MQSDAGSQSCNSRGFASWRNLIHQSHAATRDGLRRILVHSWALREKGRSLACPSLPKKLQVAHTSFPNSFAAAPACKTPVARIFSNSPISCVLRASTIENTIDRRGNCEKSTQMPNALKTAAGSGDLSSGMSQPNEPVKALQHR